MGMREREILGVLTLEGFLGQREHLPDDKLFARYCEVMGNPELSEVLETEYRAYTDGVFEGRRPCDLLGKTYHWHRRLPNAPDLTPEICGPRLVSGGFSYQFEDCDTSWNRFGSPNCVLVYAIMFCRKEISELDAYELRARELYPEVKID